VPISNEVRPRTGIEEGSRRIEKQEAIANAVATIPEQSRAEGEFIGQIQVHQGLLGQNHSPRDELLAAGMDEPRRISVDLQAQILSRS